MDNYKEEVKKLTLLVIEQIIKYEKTKGKDAGVSLSLDFLSSFIASLTICFVDDSYEKTKEEDSAVEAFKTIKSAIQESVANGMSGAMTVIHGERVDYYCDITLAPEPVNKYPV